VAIKPWRGRLRRDARHGPLGRRELIKVRMKKIIGIEAAAENDGVDMFEQAGVAAE
jgi:hypothetical protein